MSMEGTLGVRELKEVLSTLGLHRRTGILTVQGSREIIAISLLAGEIVSADALNQSLEDGLGRVLADLDLLEPESFAGLAAEHQAGGGRVVDLLVERGFVERSELLAALREHVFRLCRQSLAWREGEFKFYQGEEVSFEEGVTPIPIDELFYRAAADLGDPELANGRYPDAASIFARGGTGAMRGPQKVDPALLARLGPESGIVLAAINGRDSIAELATSIGARADTVAYVLYHLEHEGLVDEVGRQEAPRPQPEPLVAALPYVLSAAEAEIEWQDRVHGLRQRLRGVLAEPEHWPARLVGVLLGGLALVALATAPLQIALPFDYLGGLRERFHEGQSSARELRIQRAAATYHLLEGRFPEQGADLVALGLLTPADLEAEEGARVRFLSTAVSFVAQVGEGEAAQAAGPSVAGSITGNFLLDPDFGVGESSAEAPLILLD
jgi:hypothetical protein